MVVRGFLYIERHVRQVNLKSHQDRQCPSTCNLVQDSSFEKQQQTKTNYSHFSLLLNYLYMVLPGESIRGKQMGLHSCIASFFLSLNIYGYLFVTCSQTVKALMSVCRCSTNLPYLALSNT